MAGREAVVRFRAVTSMGRQDDRTIQVRHGERRADPLYLGQYAQGLDANIPAGPWLWPGDYIESWNWISGAGLAVPGITVLEA